MSYQFYPGRSVRVWTLILFASFFATLLIDASRPSRAADIGCVVANNRCRAVARRLMFRRGRYSEPSVSTPMAAPAAASALPAAKTITSATIFAEALTAARKIEDAACKASSLASLAEAEAEAGFKEQARKIFAEALAFAKQDYLNTLAEDPTKDEAICKIIKAQVKAGLLADALKAYEMVGHPWQRLSALETILPAEVQAGRIDEAIAQVRKVEGKSAMSPCCAIGVALAKAGYEEQAREMFAKAKAAVKPAEQNSREQTITADWDYAHIASAEVEAGYLDDAQATIAQTKNPYALLEIFCKIAKSYAKLGQGDRAAEEFRKAATFVAQIDDCKRWEMWVKIASAQAESKMMSEAARSFGQAVSAAVALERRRPDTASPESWPFAELPWKALTDVATAQGKANLTAEAAQTFQQAIAAVSSFKDAERVESLLQIAAAQRDAEMAKDVGPTLSAAASVAALLKEKQNRITNLIAIAALQQRASLNADALATLQSIEQAKLTDDDPVYARIVGILDVVFHARINQFEKAQAKTGRLPPSFQLGCLFYIAAQEIEAGNVEAGRQLWKQAMLTRQNKDACGTTYSDDNNQNKKKYLEYEIWPRSFGLSDTDQLMSTLVATAQAKAGLFSDALATARLLEYPDDHVNTLRTIAEIEIAGLRTANALTALAEAKAIARKAEDGEGKLDMLLSIASLEAQAGDAELSRATLAEALATTHNIHRRCPLPLQPFQNTSSTLPWLIHDEIKAGFLAEAKEGCRVMVESEDKTTLLKEIQDAEDSKDPAKLQTRIAEEVKKALPETSLQKEEAIESLAGAGRFTEAMAEARKLAEPARKVNAYRAIVEQQQNKSQPADQLRPTIAEWFAAACQINNLLLRENDLREICSCQAKLGMRQEMQQTFDARLAAAEKMAAEGMKGWGSLGGRDVSPLAAVAEDQAKYGQVTVALTTIEKIKKADLRYEALDALLQTLDVEVTINETMRSLVSGKSDLPPEGTAPVYLKSIPGHSLTRGEIRCICKAALAAAREGEEHQTERFCKIASHQFDAGLQREADKTVAELLVIVRQEKDLAERAAALCSVASFLGGQSADCHFFIIEAKHISAKVKRRVLPIFEEALAAARALEDEDEQEKALGEIADSEGNVGLLDEAAQLARSLKDLNARVDCLTHLAQFHDCAEDGQAKQFFVEAFAAAKVDPDKFWRTIRMRQVIEAVAECHFFADAMTMARDMGGEIDEKISIICSVAEAEFRADQPEKANAAFAEAVAETAKIDGWQKRADSLRKIAVQLATIEKAGMRQ